MAVSSLSMANARCAAGLVTISKALRVKASSPSIRPDRSLSRRSVSIDSSRPRRFCRRSRLMPPGRVRLRTEKLSWFGSLPTENGL